MDWLVVREVVSHLILPRMLIYYHDKNRFDDDDDDATVDAAILEVAWEQPRR
jgi:hypothetical protein